MSVTRVGKIGRLPKHFRNELGCRLEDGEPGKDLVKWLNGLPGVQRVMQEQFGGRPVTEQNLSEWKQNGHPEWLRQEETRSLVSRLTEQSEDLDEEANGAAISDRYASVLMADLIRLAATLLEKETDPEQHWQRLREVLKELSQLRRDDHRAMRTMMKRERCNREIEREEAAEEKRRKQEDKDRLRDLCFSQMYNQTMADLFGGGEGGKKLAELLHRIKFDLPLDNLFDTDLSAKPPPDSVRPDPGESNLIQPNPTKFSNGPAPSADPSDAEN